MSMSFCVRYFSIARYTYSGIASPAVSTPVLYTTLNYTTELHNWTSAQLNYTATAYFYLGSIVIVAARAIHCLPNVALVYDRLSRYVDPGSHAKHQCGDYLWL